MNRQIMGQRRASSRGRTEMHKKRIQARRKRRALIGIFVCLLLATGLWELAKIPRETFFLLGSAIIFLLSGFFGLWWLLQGRSFGIVVIPMLRSTGPRTRPFSVLRMRSIRREDLLHLTHQEFEEFVRILLEVSNYYTAVKRIGGAGDRGADLLAKNQTGAQVIVQCKHYQPEHKVVPKEIREFLGAKQDYQAEEGLFVTTSSFTAQARSYAIRFHKSVFLLEGEELTRLACQFQKALPLPWLQRLLDT